MRELTPEEKLSLFTFMLRECDTLMDYVCEFGNFDDATAECCLRHVIYESGNNNYLTVALFWADGNHIMSVFCGERTHEQTIKWRLVCDQECN